MQQVQITNTLTNSGVSRRQDDFVLKRRSLPNQLILSENVVRRREREGAGEREEESACC